MSMNPKAAQQKGDRFENYIRDIMRKEIDKNTHRVAGSGSGLDQNDVRIPRMNIEIECKNAKQFNLKGDWEQLENQLTSGNIGVLAIRHPSHPEFKKTLIVCDMNDWIGWIRENSGGEVDVVNNFAPEDKWKIRRGIESLKAILKVIDKSNNY